MTKFQIIVDITAAPSVDVAETSKKLSSDLLELIITTPGLIADKMQVKDLG